MAIRPEDFLVDDEDENPINVEQDMESDDEDHEAFSLFSPPEQSAAFAAPLESEEKEAEETAKILPEDQYSFAEEASEFPALPPRSLLSDHFANDLFEFMHRSNHFKETVKKFELPSDEREFEERGARRLKEYAAETKYLMDFSSELLESESIPLLHTEKGQELRHDHEQEHKEGSELIINRVESVISPTAKLLFYQRPDVSAEQFENSLLRICVINPENYSDVILSPVVKTLDIFMCDFTQIHAKVLNAYLDKNKTLEVLKLNRCGIDDATLKMIAHGLKDTKVRIIELTKNEISGIKLGVFSKLISNDQLQEIHLGLNPLERSGKAELKTLCQEYNAYHKIYPLQLRPKPSKTALWSYRSAVEKPKKQANPLKSVDTQSSPTVPKKRKSAYRSENKSPELIPAKPAIEQSLESVILAKDLATKPEAKKRKKEHWVLIPEDLSAPRGAEVGVERVVPKP